MKTPVFSLFFCAAGLLLCSSCSKSSEISGIYNGQFSSDGVEFTANCEVTVIDDDHVKLVTTTNNDGTVYDHVAVTQTSGSQIYHLTTDNNSLTGTVSGNVLSWQAPGAHNYSFTGSK